MAVIKYKGNIWMGSGTAVAAWLRVLMESIKDPDYRILYTKLWERRN